MMGNVVVWKPAETQVYSAKVIMDLFKAAGLPDGVVNLVTVDGPVLGNVVFNHKDFAGLHFTGSTGVFRHLWKTIGNNIEKYRSYPRIVGETGGKDFIVVHESAVAAEVATGISRGAFEDLHKNVQQHQGPISYQTFGKTSKNKLYRTPNPLKWEVLKIHLTSY